MNKQFSALLVFAFVLLASSQANGATWNWSFTPNGPNEDIIVIMYYTSAGSESDDIDSAFVKARICSNNPCTNEYTRKVKTCVRSGTSSFDCDVTSVWSHGTYKCPYCGHALFREYYTAEYAQQHGGLTEHEWSHVSCGIHVGHTGSGGGPD